MASQTSVSLGTRIHTDPPLAPEPAPPVVIDGARGNLDFIHIKALAKVSYFAALFCSPGNVRSSRVIRIVDLAGSENIMNFVFY